ncbi:MAG: hypothetical protein PVG14_14655 [Anaerolineales bacterium]
MSYNSDMVRDPTDFDSVEQWPIIHNFAPDPVNDGLFSVVELAGSSLSVSAPAYGTAFGDEDTYTTASLMQGVEGAESTLGPATSVEVEGRMELVYEGQAAVGESNTSAGEVVGSSYVYHGPQATANILIYADDNWHLAPNTYLDQALQSLGLSYTAYYDQDFAGFETALTGGGPWDLVLFGNDQWSPPATTLTALDNYVNGGGKLVFNGWTVGGDPANPLWSTLGFSWVSNDTSPPDPVYWWDPGHQFFNSPESVPEFTSLVDGRYGTYGQHVEPLAGFTAVAGYTTPGPDPNEAALIVGNDGRTIFKGFLDGHNDADLDTDGTPDGVELWINLINHMVGEVVVQAKSNVGAGDVFAIGDGDLWANAHHNKFDNNQLAWNVFAFGNACEGACYNILFDETHGWANDGSVGDYTIEDGFSQLAGLLVSKGHTVHSLQDPSPFDYATISQYDVLALMLPKESYSIGEMDAIAQFVNEGGKLVTIGEWGGFAGVSNDILNDIHNHLGDGLTHNNDTVSDPTNNVNGNSIWPLIHNFEVDPVNDLLDRVVEYAGSSLSVSGPAYGTAFGDDDTTNGAVIMQGSEGAASGLGPTIPIEVEGRMELVYEGQAAVGESNTPARGVVGSSYVYHGAQAVTNILIYADDNYHLAPNTYLDQALQALGLSYTAYYDQDFAGFETALTGGGPWDLVLFGNDQWSPPATTLTALDNYVNGGGKLIFTSWTVGSDPTNPLWSTLGFIWVSNDTSPPDPVYWWDPAHPFFNSPESVPEFTSLVDSRYGTYGQHVEPLAGFTAVAGYTTPGPDPNEAALIVGNEGRTIFKGFLDGHNDADLDTDGTPDGVELWINLITSFSEVVIQAKSNVGAGTVFAIGDANLWDNVDWDGNGISSLFEFNNEQLAWNVFAGGEVCVGEAGVALEPDQASDATPGETIVYNHVLTNTGTVEDTFTLSAISSEGWTINHSPDPTLSPGASTNVTVEVTVPGGATPGTVDTTTLTAESQFDPAVSASVVDTTTVVPEVGFIEGWVEMQGRTDHTGTEVCAWDGAVQVACQPTAPDGYFNLAVPDGTYDVTGVAARYLDTEKLAVPVTTGSTTTLSTVMLLGGDTQDDCNVNILDLSFMGARYLCSFGDACYDAKGDINDDLTINIQDLAIAGGNYLQSCPVLWP